MAIQRQKTCHTNHLYFSPGTDRLEPDSKYNYFIGTMSAFNCLYLRQYFSDRAEI